MAVPSLHTLTELGGEDSIAGYALLIDEPLHLEALQSVA